MGKIEMAWEKLHEKVYESKVMEPILIIIKLLMYADPIIMLPSSLLL